ncbi:MAG: hypothetical protein IKH28_05065 [Lachnospiraceae bacterium]|nr:hypothetical protein [Lachnospiraceae bacterium]
MLEKFIGFVIKLVLIGIGLYAILCVILLCTFFVQVAKWNYFEDFTAEQREYYAQLVALPEIADFIERYGTSGFQDVDGKVETRTFSSLDELCAVMSPDMQKAIRNTMDKEADVNSKKRQAIGYGMMNFRPSLGKQMRITIMIAITLFAQTNAENTILKSCFPWIFLMTVA